MRDLPHLHQSRRARWIFWRSLALVVVFGAGLGAMLMGVDVTARPGLADDGILVKLYSTLSLFVLGGTDLGTPVGGPELGRAMLWFAYFAAPAITTTAVVEGVLRAVDPGRWRLRRLRDHVVIGGGGRLAMLYLDALRTRHPHRRVVMVERKPDGFAPAARDLYGAHIVTGDISSVAILDTVGIRHARRILLLTGDDFANLDAAAKIVGASPGIGERVVVHVADLRFKRLMASTNVSQECEVFNIYQVAACHLVETELLPHFAATEFRDLLILAGFGRMGQTVLGELQRTAPESLAQVVLLDTDVEERASVFDEQVGFSGDYERDLINASVDQLRPWRELEQRYDFAGCSPVFVLATGDDSVNLRVALRLSNRYPNARVLARSYFRSSFSDDVSHDAGFRTFSVADLVQESLPDSWLD